MTPEERIFNDFNEFIKVQEPMEGREYTHEELSFSFLFQKIANLEEVCLMQEKQINGLKNMLKVIGGE